MKIVIVGGTGVFGQFWKKYFESKGFEVIVTSRSTTIKPEDAVKLGDVIIFSVSIRNTVNTIKNLIPYIPENKLVMDFTGIKSKASEELSKYSLGEVVATHPMFGPWISSLENQNIAFDPINPGKKWEKIYNLLKEDKANLISIDSDKHDELVSIVQSIVHFINLLLGHILKKRGIDIKQIIDIGTSNSRMQMLILSRFLNQNASLYTDMQFYNDFYKEEILPEIKDYVSFLEDTIESGREDVFEKEFNDVKDYIGQEFLDKALTITSSIDREVKGLLKN
ncbi:MAG: prephenate dehydrogenase/arogenate dehydrogenase family protein [Candidatus Gracilibacteria bacterium]|nr:prephenate dehydrogenase/arogenate dehydrogenase family protein [Candidatus Gracilibacteria bacterium]